MSNFARPKIVIASVLKPVDDSRMAEKIGLSLQSTGKYDVCSIGQASQLKVSKSIATYPIGPFNRISLSRIFAPWKIFKITLKIKPSLFIFTTHELLLVALLLKFLTRCRIVYDIQENYFRNILHTDAFPLPLRPFVAFYVRIKEILTLPFIDHYLFAEAGYEHELTFIRNHKTTIENKVRLAGLYPRTDQSWSKSNLIFTGTLAESTGIFLAIDLAKKLYEFDPSIQLKIVGYASKTSTLENILKQISGLSFVQLIGGTAIVPHEVIMNEILLADVGIICYPPNPSTEHSIPTKLYEYLGCRLPILLIDHAPWVNVCRAYNAAVTFKPDTINSAQIIETLTNQDFYNTPPSDVFWESEETKLISIVRKLLESHE